MGDISLLFLPPFFGAPSSSYYQEHPQERESEKNSKSHAKKNSLLTLLFGFGIFLQILMVTQKSSHLLLTYFSSSTSQGHKFRWLDVWNFQITRISNTA
jgi:hypothetical protein